MRVIDKIIVHCSATPEGRDVTAADIRRWHIKQGWRHIGYHYIVRLDGRVEYGREVSQVGAHCVGQNVHSIGVCYIGGVNAAGKPKDTRTPAQKKALTDLLGMLVRLYKCPVYGHRDFAAKDCPSFDAKNEYRYLYDEILSQQVKEIQEVFPES